MHSGDVELEVAKLLNYRVCTIVPNVSWGLYLNHECDMLALDKDGRFTEIEIKVSASDLRADFKKGHGHRSKIISRLVYAMPTWLCDKHEALIPSGCGIIAVDTVTEKKYRYSNSEETFQYYKARWYRGCKHDKTKEKPKPEIVNKFMSLGCMRIWSLKQHNNIKSKRNAKREKVTC